MAATVGHEYVPINTLLPADSPRLAGEDAEHVRILAGTDAILPPILVHRPTARVIDGMHRLRAAVLRGEHEIMVRYFDGSPADAFVRAVEANVTHGLPLTGADRKAAAARIIGSHPQWSDRAVAAATGLAHTTVREIRRSTGQSHQLNARVGRDGRIRPLNSAVGRRIASTVLADRPDASLREVARASGVSPATARDVRERVRRGDNPVPERFRDARRPLAGTDLAAVLRHLRRDPALRLSETGRSLLQWLGVQAINVDNSDAFVAAIPAHWRDTVAGLARSCAQTWTQLADKIDENARSTS